MALAQISLSPDKGDTVDGGIWEREVLIQGNAVFTNPANGNRIFVPLR